MAAYDKATIQAHLNHADTATTSGARGKAFEELARYLFGAIPGVRISGQNERNAFDTEEIDIACWNEQHPKGLRFLANTFLVECKGWKEPVASTDVSWFLTKIEHRGLDFGILLAANGITGNQGDLTASHAEVAFALRKRIKMIVVTRADVEILNSGEELAELIIEKVLRLHATGGRCY